MENTATATATVDDKSKMLQSILTPIKITAGTDFWSILQEMGEQEDPYLFNCNLLVEAYRDGNMYGLTFSSSTLEDDDDGAPSSPLSEEQALLDKDPFCTNSTYLLSAFCIKEENIAIALWIHPKIRRLGIATAFIELLQISGAHKPLRHTEAFWRHAGFSV